MKFALTMAIAIAINFLIWDVTYPLWKELVHKPLFEYAIDAELANRLAFYLLDGTLAAFLMIGIGFVLAAACVKTVANALSRR